MTELRKDSYAILPGRPGQTGARFDGRGVSFAFAVPDGEEAALVLTDPAKSQVIKARIPLPAEDRTGLVSSVYLEGALPEEFGYYYEVGGKKVMDPYAAEIHGDICRVIREDYDWQGAKAPDYLLSELMIYKLHVRGFTKKQTKVRAKGTFAGVKEQIPYIRELGFNAVELMPVYDFDETLRIQPYSGAETDENGKGHAVKLRNYWGYAEKNHYFAPKASYAFKDDPVTELREMVRAMHLAGIEVFLEIYFPEGTDSFMAMHAIRFWKTSYRIDGFHFIGGGVPVDSIMSDPLLAHTKIMLEYADVYRIYGNNPPKRRNLMICNDSFEHTGRALLKGDEGQIGEFARQIRSNPATHAYVHYMANVNGFTLYDSVSYDWKHNEANGEGNNDGTSQNYSWNCGVEGPSRKKSVRLLRMRQIRNALMYTFLAQGVPLLYAGDECGNTQGGNNNAYASDDATGWVDAGTGKEANEIRSFVKQLTAFRKAHPIFRMESELRGTDYRSYGCPDMSFHDEKAWVCSFENITRTLAVMYNGVYTREKGLPEDDYFYVAYNAYWDAHPFALPTLPPGYRWYPAIHSALPAGSEFAPADAEACADQKYCEAPPRSVVVLTGRPDPNAPAVPQANETQVKTRRGKKK